MSLRFLEPLSETLAACEPLTCGLAFESIPVGNLPFRVRQEERWRAAAGRLPHPPPVTVRAEAWLTAADYSRLLRAPAPLALTGADGTPLAWRGESETPPPAVAPAEAGSRLIRFPWQFLEINAELADELTEDRIEGELSPDARVVGRLELGRGARVLPGVYIEGHVRIGPDCRIGPNCYLRHGASIGAGCRIGQAVEIKNAILMERVGVPHLSYCGDSIIGPDSNLGGGTILSNFRHDGRTHRTMIGGELVDTGLRKFGAIIGHGVHTGIHTSVYPGRKIWPGQSTRPGAVVQQDLR